jgi:hypothetical protein
MWRLRANIIAFGYCLFITVRVAASLLEPDMVGSWSWSLHRGTQPAPTFFALAFAAHFILLAHAATLTVVAAGGYGRGGKRRSKGNAISTCNDRCMPA